MELKELPNNIRAKNKLKTKPKLTKILTGFSTFLVMAPGALKRVVSKIHHLIRGSFFKSSSDTLILSLPVKRIKKENELKEARK